MPNLPLPEGVTTKDLECVMLDVPTLDISTAVGDLWSEADLFYGDIPELEYAQGAVAEEVAHITLLFGIHPSSYYELRVWEALEGWDPPDILLNKIGEFPSRIEGQNYVCLYAEVVPSAGLMVGHQRLKELDYTNELDFKPHLTLVYVRTDTGANISEWKERLASAFAHKFISRENVSLNLGTD